jgi:hypothetical protein
MGEPAGLDPSARPFLFLIVDAIPFELAREAWRSGRLPGFSQPRPMVSVFPSLTNVAVGALLQGVFDEVPLGYEARHYDPATATVRGGFHDPASEGGIGHLHGHLRGVLGHLAVYLLRSSMAYGEIRWITQSFLRNHSPWLAYVPATDGVAHFSGRASLERAFGKICEAVCRARDEHQRRTGVAPGVVMASDHGMAFGRFSHLSTHQLSECLRTAGFAPESTAARGFLLVAYGDVGSGVVYTTRTDAVSVAEAVAQAPGVEIAFALDGAGAVALSSKRGDLLRARIAWQEDRYLYEPLAGDPLEYAAVWNTLGRTGHLDDGWAKDRHLFASTASHRYPDALARVRRGLLDLVQAPAPVLFSMKQNWTYGPPLTHFGAKIMGGQIGTHGALSAEESLGFATATAPDEPAEWREQPALRPQEVLRPWRRLAAAGAEQ